MTLDRRRLATPLSLLLLAAAVAALAVGGWISFDVDPYAFVPRRLRPDPSWRMVALLLYVAAPVVAWPAPLARVRLGLALLVLQGVLGLLWLADPGFVFAVSRLDGTALLFELAFLVPTLTLLAASETPTLPNGDPRGLAHRGWLRALLYLLGGLGLAVMVFGVAAGESSEAGFYTALSVVGLGLLIYGGVVFVLEVIAAGRRDDRRW